MRLVLRYASDIGHQVEGADSESAITVSARHAWTEIATCRGIFLARSCDKASKMREECMIPNAVG